MDPEVELHIIDEGFVMKFGEDDRIRTSFARSSECSRSWRLRRPTSGTARAFPHENLRRVGHHARQPLGSDKNNGNLVKAEIYDHAVATLDIL